MTDGRPLVEDFVRERGLVDAAASLHLEPLAGGVSSDIWVVDDGATRLVVKTALPELKVPGEWRASVDRSASEAGWLRAVSDLLPGACPRVLAFDAANNLLALEYLDPADFIVWKQDLLAGRVDARVAAAVGDRLGSIHSLAATRPELAAEFETDELFTELRIDPYLRRCAELHPRVAPAVEERVVSLFAHRLTLVHGDVSPKNILVNRESPVLLDAECAWWGDPAFDVAFCVNHLLLKGLVPAVPKEQLAASVAELLLRYSARIDWEPAHALRTRVALLLPFLLLARVDGRSPVEYLNEDGRAHVRAFALQAIDAASADIDHLVADWVAYLP